MFSNTRLAKEGQVRRLAGSLSIVGAAGLSFCCGWAGGAFNTIGWTGYCIALGLAWVCIITLMLWSHHEKRELRALEKRLDEGAEALSRSIDLLTHRHITEKANGTDIR